MVILKLSVIKGRVIAGFGVGELLILLQAHGWNALSLQVYHAFIPATSRGANAHMQALRASLTAKGEKIVALKVSHSAAMD
ncbi:hypothetical protein H5410_056282 [Solanum commersonii]|uniref:Uncharacterized protein n=1 Tax=Solanum commersonii TaxID=4109 RepID=A0A9J5WLT7_SOLCO|nr:hypothetical protein H5410_056282 [Solanum commersonii]